MATVAGALAVTTVQSEESKHRPILAIPNYQGKGNIAIPSGVAEAGAERARYVRPLEKEDALDPAIELQQAIFEVAQQPSAMALVSSLDCHRKTKVMASRGVVWCLIPHLPGPSVSQGICNEISQTMAEWAALADIKGWRVRWLG